MSDSDSPRVDTKDWKTVWETINTLPGGGQGSSFRARRRADDIIWFLKTIKSRKAPRAAREAARRNLPILAFVYDPAQPERGQLRWSLGYFLQNRRTRATMNGAFVTVLMPLSVVSDILHDKSMEQARWVVLDGKLHPLEQGVIHANSQDAERIVGELADRHAAGPAKPA